MNKCLRFLRPHAYTVIRRRLGAAFSTHARLYRFLELGNDRAGSGSASRLHGTSVQDRLKELQENIASLYPRLVADHANLACHNFNERYKNLQNGESKDGEEVVVRGRIQSLRVAGSKLVFIDLLQDRHNVQGLCNFRRFTEAGMTLEKFKGFYHRIRRGDIYSIKGTPHRTNRGELSVLVNELPQLLSPCLHQLPTELQDKETRIRNRHTDFLVNPQAADVLRLRSDVMQYLRQYLLKDGHIEVQTPILADSAGGAIARPFQTYATEFPDRPIALRIAPELWLKRLIIGGFDRVFEMGPSFRNEGLDLSHNPEFVTCEFYRTYTNLDELIAMTENLFTGLVKHINGMIYSKVGNLEVPRTDFIVPFQRIEFIPGIEAAIKCELPDLRSPNANLALSQIFHDCKIPLPSSCTLPHLLDRLSAIYLEPQCTVPTFITHHPECLSPLAKSYEDPVVQQRVSARAELFVNCQEIVNTYEEENSPFEQRRKFVEQLKFRDEGDPSSLDENYLEALEWGLPPTGGWGCGIDRLCMLMSGTKRIGDVLSFGTLRNVVALRTRH